MNRPLPPALTPARILDRAMSEVLTQPVQPASKHVFVIVCRCYRQRTCEWVEEREEVETTELSAAVDKLLTLDGPIAVIAVDLRNGRDADVSIAAAHIVARRIRDGLADLTRDRVDFCEEHLGVGILPAVA